jgi:beta-glucanase (GH16 family)
MTKSFFPPLALACLAFLSLVTHHAQADDWQLVWSDEFDQPGLPDPARWTYEEGFVRNQELQYYTRGRRENARVENGLLVIEARREKFPNPGYKPDAKDEGKRAREFAEYTSASLTTRSIAAWRYGRVEVRAKLPGGRGMWPAIWMLGEDRSVGWPACGEIDIMEFVGFDPDTIHGTVHTAKYNHVKKTQKGSRLRVPAAYEDFHVYALEWDAGKIDFFVDNEKYFRFTNEGTGADAWPFDKPHYLILNAAVGGAWGGAKGIDVNIFPTRYYIDYVRVYQKKTAAKTADAK